MITAMAIACVECLVQHGIPPLGYAWDGPVQQAVTITEGDALCIDHARWALRIEEERR